MKGIWPSPSAKAKDKRPDLKQFLIGLTVTSQGFEREIGGRTYRLIVVHSTALDKRKEKSLTKKWQKEKEELAQASQELARRPFACEADAAQAIELFSKEHQNKPFTFKGEITKELTVRHSQRGQPKKGAQPQESVIYRANISIAAEEEAMAQEKELASTFVLITNLTDTEKYPDVEVLREYKEQNAVEKQFRFLKNPFLLGPIFLKDNDRVKAMSFIFQLALLVAAYLEYRVRKSMETETTPLILLGKRKSTNPTTRPL
ncbi:MAG: IS1634 family transposase, partial [Firmicutes bacterium]|nr:IS1634 family transposase [Bacillota bacterium]